MASGFGEVFKALDTVANDYVAVKKIRAVKSDARIQSEGNLLKKCNSKYVVRYYDVIQNGNEIWVGAVELGNVADRDGVLSLWLSGSIPGSWKQTE